VLHVTVYLGMEGNLSRCRLTNCKVLWQSYATVHYKKASSEYSGENRLWVRFFPVFVCSAKLTASDDDEYKTEISMMLIAFATQGGRRVESQEPEIIGLLRFSWVIHSSTTDQYAAL